MSESIVRKRLKEAISRISGIPIDQVQDDSRFIEDLGLDPLAIIESIVDVEHEFGLQPLTEDLQTMVQSVDDAVQLFERQLMRRES